MLFCNFELITLCNNKSGDFSSKVSMQGQRLAIYSLLQLKTARKLSVAASVFTSDCNKHPSLLLHCSPFIVLGTYIEGYNTYLTLPWLNSRVTYSTRTSQESGRFVTMVMNGCGGFLKTEK